MVIHFETLQYPALVPVPFIAPSLNLHNTRRRDVVIHRGRRESRCRPVDTWPADID